MRVIGPKTAFLSLQSDSFLSTWTVYLHAAKACSNMIGQYYCDYDNQKSYDTEILSLVHRDCIHMHLKYLNFPLEQHF